MIQIRARQSADVEWCVRVLAEVHRTSAYPMNWPPDPAAWLTPVGTIDAWIASSDELAVAGHVVLRQPPASPESHPVAEVSRLFVAPAAHRQGVAQALLQQTMHWATANRHDLVLEVTNDLQPAHALYERAGFSRSATRQANWATPTGDPVTLHHYTWSRDG